MAGNCHEHGKNKVTFAYWGGFLILAKINYLGSFIDFTGIAKILEITKDDKAFNIIWKLILWLVIITYLIFLGFHILAFFNHAPYSKLFGWEVNKFRPCKDAVIVHDTILLQIPQKTDPKSKQSKPSVYIDNSKNKLENSTNYGQVGDNTFNVNVEKELTTAEFEEILDGIETIRKNNGLKRKQVLISLNQFSNLKKFADQLAAKLSENGYTYAMGATYEETNTMYAVKLDSIELRSPKGGFAKDDNGNVLYTKYVVVLLNRAN